MKIEKRKEKKNIEVREEKKRMCLCPRV